MSTEFAIAEVMPGKLNALVKNIMFQTSEDDPNEAVRLVNSGEWVITKPTRSWREEDGVIYFSVTSDGTTREDWIKRLKDIGKYTTQALRSQDFKPTSGVTTEVAVLRQCLFEDNDRTTKKIRAYAKAFITPDKRKLVKPNAELACLIHKKFTDKEIEAMGLWYIVAMHEPITVDTMKLAFASILLGTHHAGYRHLSAYFDGPDRMWNRGGGFAFVVV